MTTEFNIDDFKTRMLEKVRAAPPAAPATPPGAPPLAPLARLRSIGQRARNRRPTLNLGSIRGG